MLHSRQVELMADRPQIDKSKCSNRGEMDLLRKFRYNFNFWLKNCLQATPASLQVKPPPGMKLEAV